MPRLFIAQAKLYDKSHGIEIWKVEEAL